MSADVGIGGGGVSASASLGGGSSDSGTGGSSDGSSGGGGTGGGTGGGYGGGTGSGSSGGGGFAGSGGSGSGNFAPGGTGWGQTGSTWRPATMPTAATRAALARSRAYVGSMLVSADGQTLGMVEAARPGQGGHYTVTLVLNPRLGFGQREVVLLLSPKGRPSGATRIAMTTSQFRRAIAPQISQ